MSEHVYDPEVYRSRPDTLDNRCADQESWLLSRGHHLGPWQKMAGGGRRAPCRDCDYTTHVYARGKMAYSGYSHRYCPGPGGGDQGGDDDAD